MEITIFRRNEVTPQLFENQLLYKTQDYTDINVFKNEKYGNVKDLDKTKGLLDSLDKNSERYRRAAAKYLNEYELIKILCKKQVLSRAYFKLYEIIYFDQVISKTDLDCFFICEAPGSFIECVQDIRIKKNLRTRYISISKCDNLIKYGSYLEPKNLIYGDITEKDVILDTIKETRRRFPDGLDLITADGGFDVKIFVAQEMMCSKLLLCEIYLALKCQKIGGQFVIKFFDMFSHNSIIYYLLLCSFYNYVKIIKPKSSRNCNSERYLVCYEFKGNDLLTESVFKIIENFEISENKFTIIFPDIELVDLPQLKKLTIYNNIVLYEQIKTINESIKMVHSKNSYLSNLLLNIFIHKTPDINRIYNILVYKNILGSRITKCIDFLKSHFIQVNKHIKKYEYKSY